MNKMEDEPNLDLHIGTEVRDYKGFIKTNES